MSAKRSYTQAEKDEAEGTPLNGPAAMGALAG